MVEVSLAIAFQIKVRHASAASSRHMQAGREEEEEGREGKRGGRAGRAENLTGLLCSNPYSQCPAAGYKTTHEVD